MATSGLPAAPYFSQTYSTEAEYNALKRTYLSLLPPAQIIDICLIFEAYSPINVRGSVWPYDLKASIAALLAKNPLSTPPDDSQSTNHEPPPMESLKDPSLDVPRQSLTQTETDRAQAPRAPSASHSSPQPSEQTPHAPPHTPYYPYAPHLQQPAYPHAPYYPVPSHSHTSYYHQQSPYPPYNQFQYPDAHSQLQQPIYTPPPFTRPPLTRPDGTPAEDLPSYEEMIVEALTEFTDPEGAAPKDLFAWMAARYPLQTNFRPSASQALQKAFKRGRLEKRTNGRYRLNVNWEGGTTTRRNTRRPQTQAVVMMQQQTVPPPPPFGAPNSSDAIQPYPNVPYAYGYPGYPHQKPSAEPTAGSSKPEDVGEGSDAWRAAQDILKAINFGHFLQQQTSNDSSENPQDLNTSTSSDAKPSVSIPSADQNESNSGDESRTTDRARLQAQLALLAAQLAELSETTETTDTTESGVDTCSTIQIQ